MLYFELFKGEFMHILLSAIENLPDYTKNVRLIIICMFIGVVAAAAISLYHKLVLGSFIRFLLDSGATDPEGAIVLSSTKFEKNLFVRSAIKNGRTYGSVLRSVLPEGLPDPSSLKGADRKRAENAVISSSAYYIPEELRYRADNIFSKRGTSIGAAAFGILLFVLVAAVSLLVVPGIVSMMSELFGLS